MRVDIKSWDKFNSMLAKVFGRDNLPFITGCSIHSKNIKKGDIFFALKGESFNGHHFIDEAISNGASLLITDEKIREDFGINEMEEIQNINVKSVVKTLKKLAIVWRSELDCSIISITGSNGKTSTKEILNNILSKSKSVMFTKSNYNSTIGLPMSIFSISDKNEIAILEMGANKPGEIKQLCKVAKPNYGLVTNISNAHNKYFGSIENIAINKIELLKSIPQKGYAFINMDSSYLKNINLKCNLVTYGFTGKYDFVGKFLDTSIDINGSIIKLPYPSFAIAQNYLAAYSVSSTIGIDESIIIKQLENTPIYPGRGELIEKNNITFINDSYNSNFESCANGLKSIASMNGDRKILVLGDMHELGDKTESEHIKLGLLIESMNIDAVFGFGKYIRFTLDAIQSKKIKKKYHNKKNELIEDLKKYYNSGDIVYVKGSRCMKMEEVIYQGEN